MTQKTSTELTCVSSVLSSVLSMTKKMIVGSFFLDQVGVGDEIDFPSYLVTIDDKVDTVPQVPIGSEPEARFGIVPRYCARFGPSGIAQTKASNPLSPVKLENRPPSVGLSRTKMSGIKGFGGNGVESDALSSDVYGTVVETFCEHLPHNGQGNFLPPKHEENFASRIEAFDVPPGSLDEFPAASSAKSYVSRSTESKRSARDIVAMLSDEVHCQSISSDMPKSQPQKADLTNGFSLGHTGENDRSAQFAVVIPKSVCCDVGTNLGFTESGSTDWAPVVPLAKKQRLGGKFPLKSAVYNDISDRNSHFHAFSARPQEVSCNANSLSRGKDLISNTCGPTSKRIIQRTTDPLTFPSADECAEPVLRRNIVVPATFPSWHEYARLFTAAVHEEINLRVREMALMFYKVCQVSRFQPELCPYWILIELPAS
jgi:hypothetical protein